MTLFPAGWMDPVPAMECAQCDGASRLPSSCLLRSDSPTSTRSRPSSSKNSVRPLLKLKDHWAFQARTRPSPPAVKDPSWPHNPVDNFILAKLEENRLAPSPRADRRTLLRRACFDLTGLPPTIEQIRRFMADDAADAFGKLVDRLLASPEYGRRWGRHWLDLARYADTSGDGTDMPVPQAGRYRDYVIKAFNEDLPFDRFIIEQIAGDILAWEDPNTRYRERIIASGYVALARRFKNSKNADPHLIIENTLDTIGKGMLGITLSCARCHDHKFDPISQRDFYRLFAFFNNIPENGLDGSKGKANGEQENGEDSGTAKAKSKKNTKTKVPEGKIYKPGNGDTGFDFVATGLDGAGIKFADYLGKRTIVVITSSWDGEAKQTATLLNKLQATYGAKGVAVLAASYEMSKDPDEKAAALRAFLSEVKATYTAFPVGRSFLSKIHLPSGIPMYLVFDEKGKLILRRRNNTPKRILQAIADALDAE